MPAPIVAAATVAFLKGLSALMNKKAKSKQGKEQNRANTEALNLAQKRSEDSRRARVRAGASLLGGVPSTTAGGAVNTNVGLDPGLVADLEKERTYDYGKTMPDSDKGATYEFLAGLLGGAGDVTTTAFGKPGPVPSPTSGTIRPGSPNSLLTPPGGITRTPWVDAPVDQPETLTYEDLMALLRGDRGVSDGGTT